MGSILKNSPYGYTCFVTPRKGDPKRVCELTIRDLKTTLYESTIDTRSMYEENLLAFQHDGIARCYGFYKTSSLYCEIREYCEGGTLADLMEDRKRSSRFGGKQMRQYQLRVGELLYQVCQALQYLHSHGYVYRNLRCSTVEFKDKGRTQIALAGLGHLARASDLDQPPLGVTTIYAAPEILRGERFTPPADMYALGICMYILLSGEVPAKKVFEEQNQLEPHASRRTSKASASGGYMSMDNGDHNPLSRKASNAKESEVFYDTASQHERTLLRTIAETETEEIDVRSSDTETIVPLMEMDLKDGFSLPKYIRGVSDRALACLSSLLVKDPAKRTTASRQPYLQGCHEHEKKSRGQKEEVTQMIVVSDDGKDLDDELAKVLCSSLCRRRQADVLAYVACLAPATMRARLSKGTLCELGLEDIPVAAGSEMLKDSGYKPGSAYEFNVKYLADEQSVVQVGGVRLMAETLKRSSDQSVTLVLLSGLTDAWNLVDGYRSLVKQKVARVVIMGGIEVEGEQGDEMVKRDDDGYMIPDKAQNNTFDFDAAQRLYRALQEEAIQMTVVTRWAAYAAKLPLSIYDRMAKTCNPIGVRLQKAQRFSLEHLWRRACMPAADERREGLPARCDKEWFSKVFLSGKGMDRGGEDSIWDLTGTFQAYDPIAQMCAVSALRKKYFDPYVVPVMGREKMMSHEVVGLSETNHQVKNGADLARYLTTALLTGLAMTENEATAQPLMVISDDGKDLDDELAKVLMTSLERRDLAKCHGYVANLAPAQDRARLAKGTLEQLGMSTPVFVGSDMIAPKVTPYEFDVPYIAKFPPTSGIDGFASILSQQDDGQVTLVCLSGLGDAWILFKQHKETFLKKIGRVVIMGGVEVENGTTVKRDEKGLMIPDKAQNNTFDMEAANNLYRELQLEGVTVTVVTRFAAYAAKLPLTLYDRMAKTKHPVGLRLQKAQRESLEHLWRRSCLPDQDPDREGLPGRCDKAWFSKVFLNGQGMDRAGSDSIWDLTGTFQAYDPVAVLAALPGVRDRFLAPHTIAVEDRRGEITFHEVIGLSEDVPGIQPDAPLREWLHAALLNGLSAPGEASAVPSALRLLDAKEKKDGDLQALENGVDSDTETGGETPSNSHDPSTKERTSSRGSKESKGSRSTLMGEKNSIASVRAILTFRYQSRAKQAQKVVKLALQELTVAQEGI
jgi:serine/threonine protein kinase